MYQTIHLFEQNVKLGQRGLLMFIQVLMQMVQHLRDISLKAVLGEKNKYGIST
jgi:hypothetical protein